jgi:hypothetical protein
MVGGEAMCAFCVSKDRISGCFFCGRIFTANIVVQAAGPLSNVADQVWTHQNKLVWYYVFVFFFLGGCCSNDGRLLGFSTS